MRSPATGRIASGAALLVLLATGCGAQHPAAATSTAAGSAVPSTTAPAGAPTSAAAGTCVNTVVSTTIRAELIAADGRPAATEAPGSLFYGVCGATSYAVARFVPLPSATLAEQVSFQDDGSRPEFFVARAGGAWTLAGYAPSPPATPSCTAFTALPPALLAAWHGCAQPVAPPPVPAPTETSCASYAAAQTFFQALSVTIEPDGSAALLAHPATLHCGGPDDQHYVVAAGTETVHLLPDASVQVLAAEKNGIEDAPIPLSQLGYYLAHSHTGKYFELTGTITAATAVSENYTP